MESTQTLQRCDAYLDKLCDVNIPELETAVTVDNILPQIGALTLATNHYV